MSVSPDGDGGNSLADVLTGAISHDRTGLAPPGVDGAPLVVQVTSGIHYLPRAVFDDFFVASDIRLVGEPDAVIELNESSHSRRRRLTHCGSACDLPGVLFNLQGTSLRLTLIGLTVRGAVFVGSGHFEARNCTFDGAQKDELQSAIGITVAKLDPQVTLSHTEVINFGHGGVRVLLGKLEMVHCRLSLNGLVDGAIFGGLEVGYPGGDVHMVSTVVEDNGYMSNVCANFLCVRGGALRVAGPQARVLMSDGTILRNNRGYEGFQIYVDSGAAGKTYSITYRLPVPLGHYLAITDRGQVASIALPIVDDTFPHTCSARFYGNTAESTAQSSPRCAGLCPSGYRCPAGTGFPIECTAGTYCLNGATLETACPAGTFSNITGLSSANECQTVHPGHYSNAGSIAETHCARGTYTPDHGSVQCTPCGAGTYQDEEGQTGCKTCGFGHYCPQGAVSQERCRAGYYADTTGLSLESDCTMCPVGHFCDAGSRHPHPCPEGRVGSNEGLRDAGQCTSCPQPSSSGRGSTTCDICTEGYYLAPGMTANDTLATRCQACFDGAICRPNTTLASVTLEVGRWRIGPDARSTVKCTHTMESKTACRGGSVVGDDGSGYCAAGHHGPKCELCQPGFYFDSKEATCGKCPEIPNVAGLIAAIAGGVAAVLLILWFIMSRLPSSCWLRVLLLRAYFKMRAFALIPKLKILIALYQAIIYIPGVYDVTLPPEYYEWMQVFDPFVFDFVEFTVPGACIPGGFAARLMVRALLPLAVMIAVVPANMLRVSLVHVMSGRKGGLPLIQGFFDSLPFVLFLAFFCCASVSTGLFAAFSCEHVEVSGSISRGGKETVAERAFLRSDLTVECGETSRHRVIVRLAIAFISIWPVRDQRPRAES